MNNIKRDVIIICIMMLLLLHGCFYEKTNILTTENSISQDFSTQYFSENIDSIFYYLNNNKIEQAEKLIKSFRNVSLPEEIEILFNLANGIIDLNKESYFTAQDYFYKSLPLKEGILGLIYCKINIRSFTDINEIPDLFSEIPADFSSNIYTFFNKDYILALNTYYNFWTVENDEYITMMTTVENASLEKSNVLIDKIIANIKKESNITIIEE